MSKPFARECVHAPLSDGKAATVCGERISYYFSSPTIDGFPIESSRSLKLFICQAFGFESFVGTGFTDRVSRESEELKEHYTVRTIRNGQLIYTTPWDFEMNIIARYKEVRPKFSHAHIIRSVECR